MTETTWIRVPVDMTEDVSILHRGENEDDITLAQLQEGVGGLIEYAHHDLTDGEEIIVNEEGLLFNDPVVNIRAVTASGLRQILVGDAVLQTPTHLEDTHLMAMGFITEIIRNKLQEMEEE